MSQRNDPGRPPTPRRSLRLIKKSWSSNLSTGSTNSLEEDLTVDSRVRPGNGTDDHGLTSAKKNKLDVIVEVDHVSGQCDTKQVACNASQNSAPSNDLENARTIRPKVMASNGLEHTEVLPKSVDQERAPDTKLDCREKSLKSSDEINFNGATISSSFSTVPTEHIERETFIQDNVENQLESISAVSGEVLEEKDEATVVKTTLLQENEGKQVKEHGEKKEKKEDQRISPEIGAAHADGEADIESKGEVDTTKEYTVESNSVPAKETSSVKQNESSLIAEETDVSSVAYVTETPSSPNEQVKSALLKITTNTNVDLEIDHLLSTAVDSSDDEEKSCFELISFEAEEGEEDTPSEGSNDIVEVGEEINTTESELSADESFDDSSFIDDDNEYQLLSGEEFDLSLEDTAKKKRRRIVRLSSGSNDDIVNVNKFKKPPKKRKKSRIIEFSDSSDEDNVDRSVSHNEVKPNGETDIVIGQISSEVINQNFSPIDKDLEQKLAATDTDKNRKEMDSEENSNLSNESVRSHSSCNKETDETIEGEKFSDNKAMKQHSSNKNCLNLDMASVELSVDNLPDEKEINGNCLNMDMPNMECDVDNNADEKGNNLKYEQVNSSESSTIQQNESIEMNTTTLSCAVKPIISSSADTLNNCVFKTYCKQNGKRKHSEEEVTSSSGTWLSEDFNFKMKKRKITIRQEDRTNVVQEAILFQRSRNSFYRDKGSYSVWENFDATPSVTLNVPLKRSHEKSLVNNDKVNFKSETVSVTSKFHPKDFRNAMLYDRQRVKRVDTRKMLKKRC